MARSESRAWNIVYKTASGLLRSLPALPFGHRDATAEQLRKLQNLALTMMNQASEGVHANPRPTFRKNPALAIWGNPGGAETIYMDQLQSSRAIEIRYQHHEDGKLYKHEFSPGVDIYTILRGDRATQRTGSRDVLLTRPDGKSLWDDFD